MKHCVFCLYLCDFFVCGNCKVFCWLLICSHKFANKIILFYKAWHFKTTIFLSYNCQTLMRITNHVFSPLIWNVFQIIVDIVFLVVNVYVLNHYHGHCLFSNVLHVVITMALKLKTKLEWHLLCLIWWKWYNYGFKVLHVMFRWFFFISNKIWKIKTHNMLYLMLDPRFKNFRLVSSFYWLKTNSFYGERLW